MALSEYVLFQLAKNLYHSEIVHSQEMKQALQSRESCSTYRSERFDRILAACQRYQVPTRNRDVLDFGCSDGAIAAQYPGAGAKSVVGVDVDADAVGRARRNHRHPKLTFRVSTTTAIPLDDESVDTIISHDVFEHVAQPAAILRECYRVLRPSGSLLIGTWGWHHPHAPHLWATLPVPWAHVVFSERTMLRVCRRVFEAPWYVPTMHDLDEHGRKRDDRYREESLSTDYLNKFLIRDFERVFAESGFHSVVHLEPFGSKYAGWTGAFLNVPYLREFVAAYMWAVLRKPAAPDS